MKKIITIKKLNFGGMCVILKELSGGRMRSADGSGKTINVSQPHIVEALYLSVYSPNERKKGIQVISNSEASKLFNCESEIDENVQNKAAKASNAEIEECIKTSVLANYNTVRKQQLLQKLQELVNLLDLYEDEYKLKDFLSLRFDEKDKKSIKQFYHFVTVCIKWCLITTNKIDGSRRLEIKALKRIPNNLLSYDPHNIAMSYSESSAITIIIREKNINNSVPITKFHSFEKCLEFIMKEKILIDSIDCSVGTLEILIVRMPEEYQHTLKRLEREDYKKAYEFIDNYLADFRKKVGWKDRKLSDMVYEGLLEEKWTAYAYFDNKNELVSYLDYKHRIDGDIELGTQLTEYTNRNMHLARGLVNFFRLKFFANRFFAGTFWENEGMKKVLTNTNFKENYFHNPETGIETNRIRERINPDFPQDKEKMTDSVYYYTQSLTYEILKGYSDSAVKTKI